MLKSLRWLGIAIAFSISGCQVTQTQSNSPHTNAQAYEMSEKAFSYLSTGFDFIQQTAIDKETIDWIVLREEVFTAAQGAQEAEDTYPALRIAIAHLNDQHSYLHTSWDIQRNREIVNLPRGEKLTDGISLLAIPTHVDQSDEVSRSYISAAHHFIRQVVGSCGWVIDLRGNRGGNQGPMIISLAPFLPSGLDSYIWSPTSGVSYLYSRSFAEHSSFSYLFSLSKRFPNALKDKPVAVLIDRNTGSSGEATLVQFLGRANTKTFGTRTSGASSNIHIMYMTDGAILGVANGYFVDREGKVYRNGIEPDIALGDRNIIDEVTSWLEEVHRC
ncbi:S41 family peptidase [Aliidiomarina iranensis]|nr:S41 family peptidase [Aliidiomarina iranensis]